MKLTILSRYNTLLVLEMNEKRHNFCVLCLCEISEHQDSLSEHNLKCHGEILFAWNKRQAFRSFSLSLLIRVKNKNKTILLFTLLSSLFTPIFFSYVLY